MRWCSPRPRRRGPLPSGSRTRGMTWARGPGMPAVWAAGAGHLGGPGHGALGSVRLPVGRNVGETRGGRGARARNAGGGRERPVLFPCGDSRRDELPARLEDDGDRRRGCRLLPLGARERSPRRARRRTGPGARRGEPQRRRSAGARLSPGVRPDAARGGPDDGRGRARIAGWPPAAVSTRPDAGVAGGGRARTSLYSLVRRP